MQNFSDNCTKYTDPLQGLYVAQITIKFNEALGGANQVIVSRKTRLIEITEHIFEFSVSQQKNETGHLCYFNAIRTPIHEENSKNKLNFSITS